MLFPAQKATLDARLAASLAQISDDGDVGGQSIARGLEWGATVADEILAWRASDGFTVVPPPYVAGTAPGDWQPTPPAFGPPLFRQFATMTPFALTSPAQFLPAGPPPLTSVRYAQDFNEVKALGSTTSTVRTPLQTQTAIFWQVDTPAAMWNRVADDLAEANATSLSRNARLLALANISLADATIAVWNAKNTFDSWRPVTAIPNAASDGNPATDPDPAWMPLLATPQFQEYPSAHSGLSTAFTSALAAFYGNDTAFTVTSAGLPTVERSFTSFTTAIAQVADARVYAGFHFRFSCEAAVTLGTKVADYVDSTIAQPVHRVASGAAMNR